MAGRRCETREQQAARMNRYIADGRPRGSLFLLVRAAGWLIVPLYVVGICTGYLLQRRAGLSTNENPVENVALIVGFGAFAVVGALLVAKRPANPISWIMAAIALMVSIFHVGDTYAAYVVVTRAATLTRSPSWAHGSGAGTGFCPSCLP